jgi:hypothetical protein
LRHSDRRYYGQKQHNRQNLEIIRFHTSFPRRVSSPRYAFTRRDLSSAVIIRSSSLGGGGKESVKRSKVL